MAVGAPGEHRFRAMGTTVHLLMNVDDTGFGPLVQHVERRIGDLEQRWSRFLPSSEVAILGRNPGRPVVVSTETFELVSVAIDAWRATGGAFDPTVHDALVDAGYDRPFDRLDRERGTVPDRPRSVPTPATIELCPELRAITVPPGVRLDLGGIAKGAAADLVAAELAERGVAGACINVGGDLRAFGTTADGSPWKAKVGEDAIGTIHFREGGVCTSSSLRRSWIRSSARHHLIDPSSSEPFANGVEQVTVIAANATTAEALCKIPFALGPDAGAAAIERTAATGLLRTTDGAVRTFAGLEAFIKDPSFVADNSYQEHEPGVGPPGRTKRQLVA